MLETFTQWAGRIERWTDWLFLIAGVLLIPFAISFVLIGIYGVDVPENLFAGAGFTLAFLGLLGLYPRLADHVPWLARIGAVFALLGLIGFVAVFLTNLIGLVGISIPDGWSAALNIPTLPGLIFGFLLFGVAALRSAEFPRTIGILLLAPSLIFILNLGRIMALGGPESVNVEGGAIFAAGQALTLLALGYTLRGRDEVGPRQPDSTVDSPT